MAKQDGKVFIGGLSWETTDQKLRGYFENYGTVQEAFVSYDKHTGRPRGFGFVVFADPIIADKVISVQHTIDRREVEAKRALPKEESPVSKDQQAVATGQRTKKIFVGGLAATVDEEALRGYFQEFGAVDDAVVMFDHENRRPRGFGFITFVEEEAVDLVFARGTIQSIHDKQIEIKRAVPRDSMPPSPRTLQHRPPMVHNMIQSAYDHPPPDMWQQQQRAVLPPHYGGGGGGGGGGGRGGRVSSGGGGYSPSPVPSYGGYRGQYTPAGAGMSPHHSYGSGPRGAGMRSPPHRGVHHHHMGGGGPQPPFTPPAVVTGIPASMAATPEGAAALASGQTVAASLPVMSGTQMGMPAQSQLAAMSAAAQPLQAAQLVNGYAGLPSSVQAAAAAAAASQLGSPPPNYGLGDTSASAAAAAQQQAAAAQAQAQVHAAAQNLAELQQQVNLSTSLAQAQLQQAQAAQQQQQAQAAIWS
ncbi:hypothetical protein D9Q98_006111 [Chlorella vulgaris]|uniref:RRM domain-containing protein n=1 Tax=Chlorella vulgaris TaxID=3077 RepID=A0A9D4Z117_CHLVU|nr:hypothetical protein D9Q98_006111 [Chlorella vulgaris]